MHRRVVAALIAIVSLAFALGSVAAPAEAATKKPSSISDMVLKPGPRVGEITVTWKSKGKDTNHFRIETALSNFNPNKGSSLPAKGRNYKLWAISSKARSITLSRAQLTSLGASVESGNHLYIRVTPYNRGSSGWKAGSGAKTKSMFPAAQAPMGSGSRVTVASYNVRSAPSTLGTSRAWPTRSTKVAQTIVSRAPGVALLQELSPGPFSGKSGTARQTEDLMAKLAAVGGSYYKMVRTTSYVSSTTTMGTQGARIIYDSRKYELVSNCPETTGRSNYNAACSIIVPADTDNNRRPAAVARLRDLASGQVFWVVSVHLDNRDGKKYEAMRATQVQAVLNDINSHNPEGLPIIMGGDFNSWQNNDPYDNAPHNTLIRNGFYDLAAARTKVNMQYSTMNHFKTTLSPSSSVHGSRLDVLAVKGATGSERFENVMAKTDSKRGSDHNMIVATFRFR